MGIHRIYKLERPLTFFENLNIRTSSVYNHWAMVVEESKITGPNVTYWYHLLKDEERGNKLALDCRRFGANETTLRKEVIGTTAISHEERLALAVLVLAKMNFGDPGRWKEVRIRTEKKWTNLKSLHGMELKSATKQKKYGNVAGNFNSGTINCQLFHAYFEEELKYPRNVMGFFDRTLLDGLRAVSGSGY